MYVLVEVMRERIPLSGKLPELLDRLRSREPQQACEECISDDVGDDPAGDSTKERWSTNVSRGSYDFSRSTTLTARLRSQRHEKQRIFLFARLVAERYTMKMLTLGSGEIWLVSVS